MIVASSMQDYWYEAKRTYASFDISQIWADGRFPVSADLLIYITNSSDNYPDPCTVYSWDMTYGANDTSTNNWNDIDMNLGSLGGIECSDVIGNNVNTIPLSSSWVRNWVNTTPYNIGLAIGSESVFQNNALTWVGDSTLTAIDFNSSEGNVPITLRIYTTADSLSVNDVWKDVIVYQINVNDTWKYATHMKISINNNWVDAF
jgi:hypothetical protein